MRGRDLIALAITLIAGSSACDKRASDPNAPPYVPPGNYETLQYMYDARTDLCFALISGAYEVALVRVPCSETIYKLAVRP